MATPAPSSLFLRLANTWRLLALRSDVDDIVLELLGRFSLERIYAGAGDRDAYQHLVITLLSQLKAIFDLQRLTIPSENTHVGWYLGFLVSWELALRSVELVLQTVVEGRECLWEHQQLRDGYLAEFLLSALRVLTLHPKAPTNQRARDRRERFARIHGSLEQVFDSYPGPKSFLLQVCKEVTSQLHADPDALALPPKFRSELPSLTSELVCTHHSPTHTSLSLSLFLSLLLSLSISLSLSLSLFMFSGLDSLRLYNPEYPLPPCMQPASVSELAPPNGFGNWLAQFLALRDVSQYVVAASVQYAANRETRDVRLQSSSARSRNAVLTALDNLRTPPHMSRVDMVATFSTSFRIILPDTLDLSHRGVAGSRLDECELDALDAFCTRLRARQVIHRVSDREMVNNISQVVRNILLQDDPNGRFAPTRPGLYVVNCPECHLTGASQLQSSGIPLPPDPANANEIRLSPKSRCIYCGETITLAREVPTARQTWELVEPLRPDADTINVERHLPTQFQLAPPKPEASALFPPGYNSMPGVGSERSREPEVLTPSFPVERGQPSPAFGDLNLPGSPGPVSAQSLSPYQPSVPLRSEPSSRPDISIDHKKKASEEPESARAQLDPGFLTDPPPFSRDSPVLRRQAGPEEAASIHTPRTVPLVTSAEKGKSRWRLKFSASKKVPVGASGDYSSLSSTALEAQKLEEIPVSALLNTQKTQSRGKPSKNINVYLSHNSTLSLFWTQLLIHVWDVGTSPPTMMRAISPESTCILAAVAKMHLAYVIGTRDQKLTLRIVNLVQPTAQVVEYRIPSSLWCKSIAIDRQENYVVVGFENSTVRFFNARSMEQPREDRLHALYHQDCRACPPVDTLAFSNDGLVLLASTRNPKTGLIQAYCWRFPFHAFQELTTCRYPVALHESEDNGVSSAIFRPGLDGEENLVCITTWTQSGTPVLIQPRDGHRSEIRTDAPSRHGKLGNRIQCAAFSPSGRELAMVNDKGHVFQVSNLNSSPMDVRRIAACKELTAKSDSFDMSFMNLSDEECVVLAWADSSKATGWIKKIPAASRVRLSLRISPPITFKVHVSLTRH
ncbi:hypothetical protein C8A00DRAFT_12647 [Chaetomidium leptoderma]|uniref:WD40 repeat protein n=1 Tax=Chaetomidium leptoderma TaxID=669021 RepID=A0AAN6ZY73_9PEZI|nr:hypothetical protein C8A00DRAFT_12647 [Chaetomidium leptoderma]